MNIILPDAILALSINDSTEKHKVVVQNEMLLPEQGRATKLLSSSFSVLDIFFYLLIFYMLYSNITLRLCQVASITTLHSRFI